MPIPDDLQMHMRRLCDLGPGPDVTVAWHGEPAPEKVVRAARLMKAHRVAFTVAAAVHAGNADRPLDVYRFLRDEVGARFIHLIPVVDHRVVGPVSAEQWGSFLIRMFDEWVRYDIGTVFVRAFDDLVVSWWGGQPPRNAARGARDLNEGYNALFDHATQRWSRYAVSRL
jgi:sulfatase maturation enzyme AslB (radical SAM superfamily)